MSGGTDRSASTPIARLHAGLCSVTLRQLGVGDVLEAASTAGLTRIEWGGDIHVPPADPAVASQVGAACREYGVEVASYGSYFRAGPHGLSDFEPVLASAVALGAARIRIWAGDVGSAQASAEQRAAVVAVARAAASRAADAGVELAFEYHGDTLTDTPDSTLALLAAVDHPGVRTYWQPPVGLDDVAALDDLAQVLDAVSAVHVFSWWPQWQRLPLAERGSLWREVFSLLRSTGRDYDLLLEFVRDDDQRQLVADAATLARLLDDRDVQP